MNFFVSLGSVVLLLVLGLESCSEPKTAELQRSNDQLEAITKAELGEKLFFDTQLSLDNSMSCATCHIPEFAFADTVPLSVGVEGNPGKRNTPSVMNMASRDLMFYDGRAMDLEDQVHFPIEDPLEMNVAYDTVVARISSDTKYKHWFIELYGEKPNATNIANAIATFEETLETADTPFDDYMNTDDSSYLTASQHRGHELFNEKAKCFDCHFGPDFTGDEFRNIGLFNGVDYLDSGRYLVTQDPADIGKFKVPGLRNVAVTPPYMHDGSMNTLREVLEYYNDPYKLVSNPMNLDTIMLEPLNLSEQELIDLENFLIALTDRQFEHLLKE